jgi:hypothetical protein
MMDFEMGKPHLDLFTLIARLLKLWGTHECADLVAGLFIDIARDLSEWSTRASLLEFANAALSRLG